MESYETDSLKALLTAFRRNYAIHGPTSCLHVLSRAQSDERRCMIIRAAFLGLAEVEDVNASIQDTLLKVSKNIVGNKNMVDLIHFHYLVGHSDLLMYRRLSQVLLSSLLERRVKAGLLKGFIDGTVKYHSQHLVAGLELYLGLSEDPLTPSKHVPITTFLAAFLPYTAENNMDRPRLSYDQLVQVSKCKYRLSFLEALGDAGLLGPFLEDSEFQRSMLLFSGQKQAQKLLFKRKFPGPVEAKLILGSQAVAWVGYATATAAGICVAYRSKAANGAIDGGMLGSGIAYAVAQILIGVALATVESRVLPSLLPVLSLVAAGVLYTQVRMPKAIEWADLGAKILSTMIAGSELTQSFLLSRPGLYQLDGWFYSMKEYVPALISRKHNELKPKLVYAQFFVLPIAWPVLIVLISGLTLVLIWTENLTALTKCNC